MYKYFVGCESGQLEDNPQVSQLKIKKKMFGNSSKSCSSMLSRLTGCLYASAWFLICYVVLSGVCSVELYQRSCALPCKVPQARSVLVADLVNTTLNVRPYMTVLYRCDDGTGCCQKGNTCQVKHFDDLEVRFPTLINEEYVLKTYTIRNHTECSCQSNNNNIKR